MKKDYFKHLEVKFEKKKKKKKIKLMINNHLRVVELDDVIDLLSEDILDGIVVAPNIRARSFTDNAEK